MVWVEVFVARNLNLPSRPLLTVVAAALSVMLLDQGHAQTTPPKSSANVSLKETVDYLSDLLNNHKLGLIGRVGGVGDDYRPLSIVVDSVNRKIWYARLFGSIGYNSLNADDFDSISINKRSISVKCKGEKDCIGEWYQQRRKRLFRQKRLRRSSKNQVCENLLADSIFESVSADISKKIQSCSEFRRNEPTLIFITTGDQDMSERFTRAFEHLIVLVRAMPVKPDPFSK